MKDKVYELYENFDEENRLSRTRENMVESTTTIKFLNEYITKDKTVLEIGCGAGFYGFYFAKQLKKYLGVDLSQRNIEVFNEQIKEKRALNLFAEVGDALDLNNIPSSSYDVVLLLGPLYHLDAKDREKAVSEATRVCKKGGTIAIAYMSKFGNFVKMCSNDRYVGRYPNTELYAKMMIRGTDDDDIFSFTTPEQIEQLASKFGLKKLHHVATDGTTMHHHRISEFAEQEFNIWLKFHLETCEEPSILGMSDHGLLICKK